MKYDCFDYGICDEALFHRKYKCKICKEYLKPSFQVNALHRGYYLCDHIKFCFEHTGEQIEDWLTDHIKYDSNWSKTYRKYIDKIVTIYLREQKQIDEINSNNKILVNLTDRNY